MKKLLLSLGAMTAVVAPVAAVVACGDSTDSKLDKTKDAAVKLVAKYTTATEAQRSDAVTAIKAAKTSAEVQKVLTDLTAATMPAGTTDNGNSVVDLTKEKIVKDTFTESGAKRLFTIGATLSIERTDFTGNSAADYAFTPEFKAKLVAAGIGSVSVAKTIIPAVSDSQKARAGFIFSTSINVISEGTKPTKEEAVNIFKQQLDLVGLGSLYDHVQSDKAPGIQDDTKVVAKAWGNVEKTFHVPAGFFATDDLQVIPAL